MKRPQLAALLAVAIFATLLPAAVAQTIPDDLVAPPDEPRVMTSEEFAREILRDLPALAREYGVELSDVEAPRPGKLLVLIVSCKSHMDVPEAKNKNEVDEKRIVAFLKDRADERAEIAALSAEPKRLFLTPTSTNMRAYLSMIAAAGANDDVIVAILGDGVNFNREDYFIPDDGSFQISANWVGLNEIESALRRSRARRTTILWDAARIGTRVAPPQKPTYLLAPINEALESIDAVERVAESAINAETERVRRAAFICPEGGYATLDQEGGDVAIQALLDEATSVDDFFGDALDALRDRAQRRLDEANVKQTLEVRPF